MKGEIMKQWAQTHGVTCIEYNLDGSITTHLPPALWMWEEVKQADLAAQPCEISISVDAETWRLWAIGKTRD